MFINVLFSSELPLQNIAVGVTDIAPKDKAPPALSADQYRKCGVFIDVLPDSSRTRIPCASARGRYVFVKSRKDRIMMKLCEVEVYVLRESLVFVFR